MAVPSSSDAPVAPVTSGARAAYTLAWVEALKALALIWIFLNHAGEALFGFPYFGNPSPGWPPLADRIAQVTPLTGHGLLDIPLNAARYLGWTGDQGVSVFLILSGFGLTWGLLALGQTGPFQLRRFFLRRAARVYPLWWGANALALVIGLLVPAFFNISVVGYVLNLAGFRVTPDTLYALVPAWWYITLLIQLYLAYPALWGVLRRLGPGRLLLVTLAVALPIRLLGLLVFTDYLDAWSRGAIFITRLPEFALGISLAAWMHADPRRADAVLRSGWMLSLAVALFVGGLLASFTLVGMAVAPLSMGAGAFVLLYAVTGGQRAPAAGGAWAGLHWLGLHSYSLYLAHHLVILFVIPAGLDPASVQAWTRVMVSVVGSVGSALVLERAVDSVQRVAGRWRSRFGWRGIAWRAALTAMALCTGLVALEFAVRQFAPQEVYGWAERPALAPSEAFGWTLKPESETRLRWESYDYVVRANALGFPGPEYPADAESGVFRVLVTGDAFTSGEGVAPEEAWPRLLAHQLSADLNGQRVEVLNFGITGYGPDQMARVVEAYTPIYQPDLIIVEFFVNEFDDVLVTDGEFRNAIGFSLAPQDSLSAVLTLAHLRQFAATEVIQPLSSLLSGRPSPQAYFYAGIPWLEIDHVPSEEAQFAVEGRLQRMRAAADAVGADIVLVMVPAAAQVCSAGNDPGWPRGVDLTDSARYDVSQPQRALKRLAERAGVRSIDLRAGLMAEGDECPYQPFNLHWLPLGHQRAAATVADFLIADGFVRGAAVTDGAGEAQ